MFLYNKGNTIIIFYFWMSKVGKPFRLIIKSFRTMKHYYITLLMLLLPLMSFAKEIRVLAIGNSFSEDAVEQYLYELCVNNKDTLIIGNAYRGGQGLESHWNAVLSNSAVFEYRKIVKGKRTNTKGKTLKDIVTDEPWDIITFQQVSQDSGLDFTYEPYLTNLINYVKDLATNSDLKFGLHQTWAYAQDSNHGGFANYSNNQMKMYNAIVNAVNKAKENHPEIVYIVPSGTAIQNARTTIMGDNLNRDGFHLETGVGRYTAACTWMETLTGKSSVGNEYRPYVVDVTAALLAQKAANNAVQNPNSVTDMKDEGYDGDNTIVPENRINLNLGGSVAAEQNWNNITQSIKVIANMKDDKGNMTEIVTLYNDRFNDTNAEGKIPTNTEMNMPDDVAKTCFWGYAKGQFLNFPQDHSGGFLFTHLNKSLTYDFLIFGSRKAGDYRETIYTLVGGNEKSGMLDTADNTDRVLKLEGMTPNENGEIQLTVTPGANNTNAFKFYHINALQIIAHASDADGISDVTRSAEELENNGNSLVSTVGGIVIDSNKAKNNLKKGLYITQGKKVVVY
jgi:hypothetical protein